MINICDKSMCCGCAACVQRCPKQCIAMRADSEGFFYPLVDAVRCIDCGLCEKVCPMLNPGEERVPLHTYAARCTDEDIRRESSSGGVFSVLACEVLAGGGVVFGTRFDNEWGVVHDFCTTPEGLAAFRGSKYVQSNIGDNYIKAEAFLKEGRRVLFSGTPCQIAGLKRFLRREYDNLLAVEVACHGVPSPLVWRRYLEERGALCNVENVIFRDKSTGWKSYSVRLSMDKRTLCEPFYDNEYMKAFIYGYSMRPSCYNCKAKARSSGADILLADLWGAPHLIGADDDDKGMSLVAVDKEALLPSGKLWLKEIEYSEAVKYNSSIVKSVPLNEKRDEFFVKFAKGESIAGIVGELTRLPIAQRALGFLKRVVKKIIGRK
ncbi:MAG: Coenzyme F420 hydrogenase/dehydrogenase, beta subunit C-terminal domain [Bacteroidaceae bacterium]|nr:Coenzyme F420 hydrogenase/dehydrogenase, beta subunit C-terminal domain [Bacteroidaceae bacterium]